MPRSRLFHLLLLLTPWLLLSACHGPAGPKPVCETCRVVCGQCEEPDRFVRLASVPRDQAPDQDPLVTSPSLPPEAWATLLAGISVRKQPGVPLPFLQPATAHPAFTADEIAYLSTTLPQAFAQAQPGDVVVFAISHAGSPDLVELTSGGWFFTRDGLHLRLANYHYVASMASVRDLVWENPLHAHLSAYEFVPRAHQAVKEEPASLRAQPVELVVSHESILDTTPRRGGGAAASAPESPAPTQDAGQATVEDRLRTLKRLYEQGLISDDDYRERKRLILNAL
jgi:hypothetical protein